MLQTEIEIEMAARLPDELIVEILSFLPAKSLLRWRSVSKYWLNLINSTKFKLMHLHNFNQVNPRCFIRRLLADFVVEEFHDVHFDDEAFTFDDSTQIDSLDIYFRTVGCCNGVVCLCDDDDGITSSSDMVILWNPSIRRKLTLTLPEFNSSEEDIEESHVILGFGYDKMSDDYKVVSLTYPLSSSIRPQVEVYSVKTGIWREVMFPHNLRCSYIQYNRSQIFSNGCVHWIASDPTPGVLRNSIMTFDITTELFGEIQLPEFLAEKLVTISLLGESLAVIHSSDLNFDGLKSGSTYMVMVMKEHKNPASWTMLYRKDYPDLDLGKPLRLRNNGDMIVELKNGDTIMFNNNEGYYVYLFRDSVEEDSYWKTCVDKYQESLALLDVGDSVPNKEAMEALMMIEKQCMWL